MSSDGTEILPTDFDSKSFLQSIVDLKKRLEPMISCQEGIPIQELDKVVDFIQVVESGNATIASFKLFSMYSQEQLHDLRHDFEAIVRIMENTSTETAVPRPRKGYGKYVCYQTCPNI